MSPHLSFFIFCGASEAYILPPRPALAASAAPLPALIPPPHHLSSPRAPIAGIHIAITARPTLRSRLTLSIIMHATSALVVLASLAAGVFGATYTQSDSHQGAEFLSSFTHEAIADPTHGRV